MERTSDISACTLKMIAILGMTGNHAAAIFESALPYSVLCMLTGLGGLTFPIMAYALVEGYCHTSNVARYALRLFVFACITQVPFQLFLASKGNVLFTLLIGLGVLYARDHIRSAIVFWLLATMATLASICCDWGLIGIVMILVNAMAPQQGAQYYGALIPCVALGVSALTSLIIGDVSVLPQLFYAAGCAGAAILLLHYQGRRGRPLQWFFYVYYPAHITVLGIVSRLIIL